MSGTTPPIATSDDHPPERKAKPRRHSRWPILALGLVLFVFVGLVGGRLWLASESGRSTVARLIEHFASQGIRGSVVVGSLDEISFDGVVGHDIRFLDESGELVLEADEAELAVDWGELLTGHFVSPHGRVHGGRVILQTIASGRLLIDRAFESPDPGPAGQPVGDDIVRLEALAVSDIDVRIAIHGAPEMRVEHAAAIVLLRAPDHAGARLRVDRIDAGLHLDAPAGIEMASEDGTLTLDGDARRRAVIALPATLNGESMEVDIEVDADTQDDMHVDVHLIPSGVGSAIVQAPMLMQALLAESLSDELDVTVDLP